MSDTIEPNGHPRTAVRDAILANVTPTLDAETVEGVEWASVSDTLLACWNRHPLLDFDEYRVGSL